MPDDRAGDRLREKTDIKGELVEPVGRRLPSVQICEIGNLLKGEAADRERQDYRPLLVFPATELGHAVRRGIGVFEYAQDREIEDAADRHDVP
ncbi:MAG: hypothetical protein V3S27_05485 [Kiloniellales bacterium]